MRSGLTDPLWSAMWPAVVLCALGCVELEGFDPVGDVAAVSGSWTIDGAPVTESACERLGADRVRVTFLDGARPVPHSNLVLQCRTSSFTTVGAGGAVVGAGRWRVRLEAIDSDGNLVVAGPCQDIIVPPECAGAEVAPVIAVPHASFLSATISAGFLVGGQDPNRDRCAAAGVREVALLFEDLGGGAIQGSGASCRLPLVTAGCGSTAADGGRDAGARDAGVPEAPAVEPCAAGFVGARALPGHTYRVRVRSLDEGGGTVRETPVQTVVIPADATADQYTVRLDTDGRFELGP